jgi:hypothetical protein
MPSAMKNASKWTENGATGHPKSQKSRKKKNQKISKKQTTKKCVNVIKNDSKRD